MPTLTMENNSRHKETYIYIKDLSEAVRDARERENLTGPFYSAEDAVKSMLEDDNV